MQTADNALTRAQGVRQVPEPWRDYLPDEITARDEEREVAAATWL